MMKMSDEHEITVKSGEALIVKKVPVETGRPHADGCVGCRRAAVCVSCGEPSTFDSGRCHSGACEKCCAQIHKHAHDNRKDLVVTEGHR